MRNLWKVGALSAVFGAVLGMGGCSDFEAAYEGCQDAGRCGPQASGDGGSDAGDSGVDAGDLTPPECGDGGTDYPDLMGFDQDCDGIDGNADAGYFVDPVDGLDENNGSRRLPFRTLARALQEIRTSGSGRTIVYLGTGTYNEPAPVVDIPVSLHGGYTWRKNGNPYWDRFKDGGEPTRFSSGPLGFFVHDITALDAGVLLDAVHVASADATNDGEASIALRVRNTRELILRDAVLESGRGATGAAGDEGSRGLDGGNGAKGLNWDAGNPTGGGGGTAQCTDGYAGGIGGRGGGNGNGNPGSPGKPLSAGGGAAGVGGSLDGGCSGNTCTCTGGDGGVGASGNAGAAGTDGDPGKGSGRILADTTWEAGQQGGDGLPGAPGQGGGGGGGGGNCSELNDPVVNNPNGAGGG
ncbi:hypothetical protein, partial [Corallococcus exercitus]